MIPYSINIPLKNFDTPTPSLWTYATTENYDLNNLKYTLAEEENIFFIHSCVKDVWNIQKNYHSFLFTRFLKQGVTLHFNKLEFPKPNTFLCQVLLKFAQWFWGRRRKCTNKKKRKDWNTDRWSNCRRTWSDQKKITWTFSTGALKFWM